MNDLDAALRATYQARSHTPEPPALLHEVLAIPGLARQEQHSWLPLPQGGFKSMFGATKFAVAGVIVALFGGFLLAGVLTQQPRGDRLPAVGASAAASAQAEPTSAQPQPTAEAEAVEMTTTPDLLPGVDLVTEEVEPGVYQVLRAGDQVARGRAVVVSDDGDVWLLSGDRYDGWDVVRLGDPTVSLQVPGKNRTASFGLDRSGRPRVDSARALSGEGRRVQVFDGTAWVKTDPVDPACRDTAGALADGSCWGFDRQRRLEGDSWRTELGLADDQFLDDALAVGPDGTGWASVRTADVQNNELPDRFDGLLHYDGETWTYIPYPPSEAPSGESEAPSGEGALTWEMAVAPDGTVWLTEFSIDGQSATIRSWDGATWSSYGPSDQPDYSDYCHGGCGVPRGIHFDNDGTIWFGAARLFFDGVSLHTTDMQLLRRTHLSSSLPDSSIAPDGTIWVAKGGHLYAITPEAVTATD